MKRDKLKELLGDAATDEIIDAIMSANGKDVNAAKAPVDDLKAQLEEANNAKAELQAAADANKTDEQKWQEAIDAANKTAAKAVHALNEQSAIAVFAKAGISEDEYKPLLPSIVHDNRKDTVAAAEAIAAIIDNKVTAAVDEAKKQALANMEPPKGGNDDGSASITTKEQFRKLSDSEQIAWKSENPDAWKQLK